MRLLKTGGRLVYSTCSNPNPSPNPDPNPNPNPDPDPDPNPNQVYSTCSLNPIENEAVVAAMLRTFGEGTLRLVDVSSELPELRRRAGLSTWRVWYRAQWQASWDELQARFPRKCPPFESLFPPTAEEAREMHLERCMRLLPHDNDGTAAQLNVMPPPRQGPSTAPAPMPPQGTPGSGQRSTPGGRGP